MMCDCDKCKATRAAVAAAAAVVYEQPEPGREFTIRYRVLGQSKPWKDMTVVEIVGGPQDGEIRVLDVADFTEKLTPARRGRHGRMDSTADRVR